MADVESVETSISDIEVRNMEINLPGVPKEALPWMALLERGLEVTIQSPAGAFKVAARFLAVAPKKEEKKE